MSRIKHGLFVIWIPLKNFISPGLLDTTFFACWEWELRAVKRGFLPPSHFVLNNLLNCKYSIVNANMIRGKGSPQLQNHWYFTVFRARRGGGVHEHLQDLPRSDLKFSLIMVISASSENHSLQLGVWSHWFMMRTFQWLLEDTLVDLGEKDLGTHTQQGYVWGASILIFNPLPFLYTIFHRRGTPFSISSFKNFTLVFEYLPKNTASLSQLLNEINSKW